MGSVLDGLNTRIIDRWFGQACLNGLPFVALLMVAHALGQGHAFDARLLGRRVDALWTSWHHTAAETAVLVVLVLAAAAIADVLAEALGARVAELWLGRSPWLLKLMSRRLAARRAAVIAAVPPQTPQRYLPVRATAAGDRLRLVEERVDAQYGIHLGLAWPRIWILTPESARGEVQNAWDGYQAAATRLVWGTACLAVGCDWWPAAVAGAALLVTAQRQGRHAIGVFCALVEAVVDTTVRQLAEALGIALPHGQVTPDVGTQLDDILAKGSGYPLE